MATDTKELILDVAERLFADRGFAATSLRDITSEAGVNLAAVNYHFGSKEELLAAIVERRFGPVNQQRLERLNALEAMADDKPPALEEIIRAFLSPPFHKRREWSDRAPKFMRLIGRLYVETGGTTRARFVKHFEPVIRRFVPALHRALPQLESKEVGWRLMFVVGAMAHTMMWSETSDAMGVPRLGDPEETLETLVQFAAAGMSAPTRSRQHLPVPKRRARR